MASIAAAIDTSTGFARICSPHLSRDPRPARPRRSVCWRSDRTALCGRVEDVMTYSSSNRSLTVARRIRPGHFGRGDGRRPGDRADAGRGTAPTPAGGPRRGGSVRGGDGSIGARCSRGRGRTGPIRCTT
jgi:hypothetical protein